MSMPTLPPLPSPGSSLRPIEEKDLAAYGSALDLDGDDYSIYYDDDEIAWGDRFRTVAGHVLVRLGWFTLAAGLALGSAGIVAAGQHPPSTGSRPELTWAADKALSAKLDSGVRDLARLNDDVDSLGVHARAMLAGLTQLNLIDLQAAWDAGWNNVTSIDAESAGLASRLNCGAWDSASLVELSKMYSQPLIARYHGVCVALQSVAPLHADWQAMVDGSQTAIRVVDDIETHDSVATESLKSANLGRWPEAKAKLSEASASITDATAIAASLAGVTDVSTLTSWLARTTAMDTALQQLWQAMIDSKGLVTKQVTAALQAKSKAQALLPDTNNALEVVVYEVAGDLTAHGISIETARGELSGALADLTGVTPAGG